MNLAWSRVEEMNFVIVQTFPFVSTATDLPPDTRAHVRPTSAAVNVPDPTGQVNSQLASIGIHTPLSFPAVA